MKREQTESKMNCAPIDSKNSRKQNNKPYGFTKKDEIIEII